MRAQELVALASLMTCVAACRSRPAAPPAQAGLLAASVVAAGKPHWIESSPDEPLLSAHVDVGTIHAAEDALEVDIRWPIGPGDVAYLRAREPGLVIPDGSVQISRERVLCKPAGLIFFEIRNELRGPNGAELRPHHSRAADKRAEAEAEPLPYGGDPRSLACFAAARKCAGQPWSWPPPPNLAPLDDPERAARMRAEYARLFVPSCRLP